MVTTYEWNFGHAFKILLLYVTPKEVLTDELITLQNEAACSLGKQMRSPPLSSQAMPYTSQNGFSFSISDPFLTASGSSV